MRYLLLLLLCLPLFAEGPVERARYALDEANARPWGIAWGDERLWVCDSRALRIFAYRLRSGRLRVDQRRSVDLGALPGLEAPSGLAWRDGRLYLLSAEGGGKLWELDPDGPPRNLDLAGERFGLDGCELLDLAADPGALWLSYDTSALEGDAQVRRGLLRITPGASGDPFADDAALATFPASGRALRNGRAKTFGIASGRVDGHPYLWGTSHHKYLYLADGRTGRGVYAWRTAAETWGLVCHDDALWAVEREAEGAFVRVLDLRAPLPPVAPGVRTVRSVRLELVSEARSAVEAPAVLHHHALPAWRAGQGYDSAGLRVTSLPPVAPTRVEYAPAGDPGFTQSLMRFPFDTPVARGDTLVSTVEADVWTGRTRDFVYPHHCTTGGGDPNYLEDARIYGLDDDEPFARFLDAALDAAVEEYGPAARDPHPYWLARTLVEFIQERYSYGNVRDRERGHYSFNPADAKLRLLLDDEPDNDQMTCSSSSFALIALARRAGIPARWVGTSIQRGGWDADGDGLFGPGESSEDEAFHRWAELWLGPQVGWQRFDPTPRDEAGEQSQFRLMGRCAQGVGSRDLVLTLGSGDEECFAHQRDGNQRYNLVGRYGAPRSWRTRTRLVWSNACFLTVAVADGEVRWEATGRWDLDPQATLQVDLVPLRADGDGWTRENRRLRLASGLPVDAGSHAIDPDRIPEGVYRVRVEKVGDRQTGGESEVLRIGPDGVEALPRP